MTTDQTKPDCGCPDTPPKDECGDCDTTLIDKLRCKAAGVAEEAAYNATYQVDVGQAQKDYNDIRSTYRKKRTEVKLQIDDMRHETKRAIERIKCLIKQPRVKDCLDEAWCEVKCELDGCANRGCCVKPDQCDFPLPETDACDTDLKKLIAEYTERAAKARACFDSLKGEAEALAKRVADLKTDLDAILAKLNANDASTDLKLLYAEALVLRYRLANIWNGFPEVKDFVDCLCQALTCWTEGSAQIAILKGRLAVLECEEKAEADRCAYVTENTEDEILAVYEKKCCPEPCPPDTDTDECEDDGEDDDHHHHHGCDCDCHSDKPGASAG